MQDGHRTYFWPAEDKILEPEVTFRTVEHTNGRNKGAYLDPLLRNIAQRTDGGNGYR